MNSTQGLGLPPTNPSSSTARPGVGEEHVKKPKENLKITMLEEKIAELTKKLEDPSRIVKQHHDRLHKYNEVKDTAQSLIAIMNGTTRRAVHEHYGLPVMEVKEVK